MSFSSKSLTAIIAISDDGVIGVNGKLPWHLPSDLARFKTLTTGHSILMGRLTHKSIGRPLPHRRNIVVSSKPCFCGCEVFATPVDALHAAYATDETPFVIGGAQLYTAMWPLVTRVELTHVHRRYGDAANATRFEMEETGFATTRWEKCHEHADVEFATLERRV